MQNSVASQEEALFHAARAIPSASERMAFLDNACAADTNLRKRLLMLLEAHQFQESLLQTPAIRSDDTHSKPDLEPPEPQIGPYHLIGQIGEGGMGVVYIAEQRQPIKRQVALKVIKPGMDSRQVIARFEAERQALALMDHPHIARVIDGGTTGQGRPYFVMELVRGLPITEHCDRERLTIRQRLALFIQVCQAVQHAHQKGIIHRDLKPSNVMIAQDGETPVPKVIDFGVAKAINQELTEKTIHTQFAQLIGTPLYMSPEQAQHDGQDIDTRSDVYSLGVLLYELLTGTTPFESDALREKGLDELWRMIREDEPAQPSQRVSTLRAEASTTIGQHRGTDVRRLKQLVQGELDWIVMRALEKDRGRRYQSASDLAADLERYLQDEIVLATPPSLGYRAAKFCRKRKSGLGIATVTIMFLLALAGMLGWQWQERNWRERVVEEQTRGLLMEADEYQAARNVAAALEKLRQADAMLNGNSRNAELTNLVRKRQADLQLVVNLEETLSLRHSQLMLATNRFSGFTDVSDRLAQRLLDEGIDLRELPAAIGHKMRESSASADLAAILDEWALAAREVKGEHDEQWIRLLQAARVADPDTERSRLRDALQQERVESLVEFAQTADMEALSPATLLILARALAGLNREAESIHVLRQAQQRFPADFWINLTLARRLLDHDPPENHEDAGRFFTAAVALRPDSSFARNELAICLLESNRVEDAIGEFRQTMRLGPTEEYAGHFNLGNAFLAKGDFDDALREFRQAILLRPDFWQAHTNLANVYMEKRMFKEAESALREGLNWNPRDAIAHYNLGLVLSEFDRIDDAIASFQEAVRLNPNYYDAHYNLGIFFYDQGRTEESIAACRRAVEVRPKSSEAWHNLGVALTQGSEPAKAIEAYQRAVSITPDPESYFRLAFLLALDGRLDEATQAYQETVRLDPRHAGAYNNLALVLGGAERWPEAIAAQEQLVRIQPEQADSHWGLARFLLMAPEGGGRDAIKAVAAANQAILLEPASADAWEMLGVAHYRGGNWRRAVNTLRRSLELNANSGGALFFLAMAHWKLDNQAEARSWFDKGIEQLQNDDSDKYLKKFHDEAARLMGVD